MFVASRMPAGGLENALPLSGWLPNDGPARRYPVLWRGSKQERRKGGVTVGADGGATSSDVRVVEHDQALELLSAGLKAPNGLPHF